MAQPLSTRDLAVVDNALGAVEAQLDRFLDALDDLADSYEAWFCLDQLIGHSGDGRRQHIPEVHDETVLLSWAAEK